MTSDYAREHTGQVRPSNRNKLPPILKQHAPPTRQVRRLLQDIRATAAAFGVTVGTARRWRRNNDLPLGRWAKLAADAGEAVRLSFTSRVRETRFSLVREAIVRVSGASGALDRLQVSAIISQLGAARLPRTADTYQYIVTGMAVLKREEYVRGAYQATVVGTSTIAGSKVDTWEYVNPSQAYRAKAKALAGLAVELEELDPLFRVTEVCVRSITGL